MSSYGKRVIDSATGSIEEISSKATSALNSALTFFRIYIIVIFSVLAVVGFIGGYLVWTYVPGYLSGFTAGWITLAGFAIITMVYLRGSLSKKGITAEASSETKKLIDAANSKPVIVHDLSPLRRFTKSATSGIVSLATNALELLPTTNQIVEHQNKKMKQQQFVENFVFALRRYNIGASNEAQQIMITKSWLFDDVNRWLDDISNEMSLIFYKKIDPAIFKLIYYEFFDEKSATKLWDDIHTIEEIRKQIVWLLIRNGIIKTPNAKKSTEIISLLLEKMPYYSLEEIKNRASNFFVDLTKFKECCIRYLDFYGIRIVEKESMLMQFVPTSKDMNKWRDEVMNYISKIISKQPITIKLLILSAEGDNERIQVWTEILTKKNLDELVEILSSKRVRPKISAFDKKTFAEHLKLAMLKTSSDFSLTEIETALESIESEILNTKYRIQRTLEAFHLGYIDTDKLIKSYVPSDNFSIVTELLSTVARKVKVDKEIFSLLYSSANGLENAQYLFQKLLNDTEATDKLGTLLIEKSFVNKSKFSVNIVWVLKAQTYFDLATFVSVYSRYERLSESLDSFYPFLTSNGVLIQTHVLHFSQVIQIAPVETNNSLEDQLEKIAQNLLNTFCNKRVLTGAKQSDLALAATALFMRTHGYSGYSTLCRRASRREFATKVLFNYIKIVDEERLSGSKETLKNAINRALKKTDDLGNYEYFKTELADGKLAPNAAYLASQFKKDIKTEINNIQSMGFDTNTLQNYVDSIKDLLQQKIDKKVVREFLLSQVLSAYMLTVPGNIPGIGFVTREINYIHKAEKKMAKQKNDPTYENLIRLSPGGGKATRIGLVPLELDFDEFSTKFNEVWTLAVKLYCNEINSEKYGDLLPCYLIRIFPSDDGLKEVMQSEDVRTKPLETIRDLIQNSVRNEDNLSLLSIIQNEPTGKIALINVIKAIYDNPKTTLYKMIKDQVGAIIDKSDLLTEKFENREIETMLFEHYNATNILSLGKRILKRMSTVGKEIAAQEFHECICNEIGTDVDVSSTNLEVITSTLFNQLKPIGLVSSL